MWFAGQYHFPKKEPHGANRTVRPRQRRGTFKVVKN